MSINKSIEEKEPEILKESFPPFILFKKTLFKDVATRSKFIGAIIGLMLIPLMVIPFINPNRISPNTSMFEFGFGYVYFIINISVIFSIIISMGTAPLISYEIKEGIMLMLVSKPINRTNIFLSKFLAVFLFGSVISFISLSLICLLTYAFYPFYDILPFFAVVYIYSLIVLLFFECVTMGISCISRKPKNVVIIPVGLIIFLFLAFLIVKSLLMMGGTNNYEKYGLYIFDLGYHFANFYFLLVENLLNIEINGFFMIYGVAKYTDDWDLVYTNYVPPVVSLILLISIAILIVLMGYFYFSKKDIHS